MSDEPLVRIAKAQGKPRQAAQPKRWPRYNVVLHNDQDHSYEYVIAMLMELFGHSIEQGFKIAKAVDSHGRAVVLTTSREHAELKRDQIHAYGKDCLIEGCRGSMWASIEPLPCDE